MIQNYSFGNLTGNNHLEINKLKTCLIFRFQVFDDVAIELTMAVLQFFSTKPIEEHLFRTLKALSKFVTVSVIVVTEFKIEAHF